MIKIKINDQPIELKEGTTLIEAADLLKIPIPRFCYHEKLSIAANCRVCIVEVVNSSQLLSACATLAVDGMEVFTASEPAIRAQQNVMEFLLANHPLECPICDKAGECELQDLSVQFGNNSSRFKENKRSVSDLSLGSLITTNMSRCIHCTRCVRFGEEIAGNQELGVISRGENIKISTYVNKTINSEVSGNMIDLCPVGALNSKPYEGIARSWELQQKPGISYHDCIGSNLNYHVNNKQIKRIVPGNNDSINSIWISDRDRFSYTAINDAARLRHPLIKQQGKWQIVSWSEALSFIVDKLSVIMKKYSAHQIGGLISPNASLEECYLFQKLCRNLGSNNIDHRLRQTDFRNQELAPLYPNLGLATVQDLAKQKCIFLIGSCINKEQPIAGIILRAAVQQGSYVVAVNPVDFDVNFEIKYKYIADYADFMTPLLKITKAIIHLCPNFKITEINLKIKKFFKENKKIQELNYGESELTIANQLLETSICEPGKISIILGALAINHPDYSNIVAVSNFMAILINASWGSFTEGANSAGAWLSGCLPHRSPTYIVDEIGQNALQMLIKPLKAYFLFGIEPELDCAHGVLATKTLQQAELVIAVTGFESELLMQYSEVLLPMNLPPENNGTYINITGLWQKFTKGASTIGSSKPGTEILLELGKNLKLSSFIDFNKEDIANIDQIIKQSLVTSDTKLNHSWQLFDPDIVFKVHNLKNNLVLVAPIGLYAVDQITRRSECLQQTKDAQIEVAINDQEAKLLGIKNGEVIKLTVLDDIDYRSSKILKLPIIISNKVAKGCVLLYQVNLTTALGLPYNNILLEKIMLENIHV